MKLAELQATCSARPYQERYYWHVHHNQLIAPGSPATGVFTYRGFVIKQTADYDIYKPYLVYALAPEEQPWLRELYVGLGLERVHGILNSLADLSAWYEALPSNAHRQYEFTHISADGIPWEIHRIEPFEIRQIAIEAYLDAH